MTVVTWITTVALVVTLLALIVAGVAHVGDRILRRHIAAKTRGEQRP